MKIGIILHPYGEDKPSGLARTIFEWTNALLEIDRENDYTLYLKKKPISPPKFSGHNWRFEILGSGLLWQDRLRGKPAMDAYIFQTPRLPFFYTPAKSIIITQDYPYKYLKAKSFVMYIKYKIIGWYHKRSLKRAYRIIAVSQWAKDDTMRFFGIPAEKISVIPMGYKKICDMPESIMNVPDKFFLFVGVIKERKNFFNIIKAYKIFKEDSSDSLYKLAVGGKNSGGYFESVKDFIHNHNLKEDIIFLGHLNDNQLSFIYKRARALIFPSIVESFGMPVLEAMNCGVPVITSNFGGPAEIGTEEAALLVNPHDPYSIAESIKMIAEDDNLRMVLIKKGIERSKEYSWHKTATATILLLNSIYDR